MKKIKCRRCHKTVTVEDSYPFKTCETCRVRDREDRRVESETKKFEEKLVKDLKVDKKRMPELLWSYKNYCDAVSRFWKTRPSYEEYEQKVKEWVHQQIEYEADLKLAREKRRRETENDPWEREGGFLGGDRDKLGEALARRERNMKTVDVDWDQILNEPEHKREPEEPLTEHGKRACEFFKEQLGEPEQPKERNWKEDLEENIAKINKDMKPKKEDEEQKDGN